MTALGKEHLRYFANKKDAYYHEDFAALANIIIRVTTLYIMMMLKAKISTVSTVKVPIDRKLGTS